MRIPIALGILALAALTYVVQAGAGASLAVWVLLIPLWYAWLINAGFACFIIEVMVRRIDPAWLAAPALWFGGYAAYYAFDQYQLAQLREEIAHHNAAVHVAFDPRRTAIVGDQARGLVEHYGLPMAYSAGSAGSGAPRFSATVFADSDVCARIKASPAPDGVFTTGFHDYREGVAELATGYCIVALPLAPDRPYVTVTRGQEASVRAGSLVTTQHRITIDPPDGEPVYLRSGRASPLLPYPVPVVFCDDDQCLPMFWRRFAVPLIQSQPRDDGDTAAVAAALGLKRTLSWEREAPRDLDVPALMRQGEEEDLASALTALDQRLAHFADLADFRFLDRLVDHPERVRSRLGRIVAAIESNAGKGGNVEFNARLLYRFVLRLPPSTLAPFRPRLDAIAQRSPWYAAEHAKAEKRAEDR